MWKLCHAERFLKAKQLSVSAEGRSVSSKTDTSYWIKANSPFSWGRIKGSTHVTESRPCLWPLTRYHKDLLVFWVRKSNTSTSGKYEALHLISPWNRRYTNKSLSSFKPPYFILLHKTLPQNPLTPFAPSNLVWVASPCPSNIGAKTRKVVTGQKNLIKMLTFQQLTLQCCHHSLTQLHSPPPQLIKNQATIHRPSQQFHEKSISNASEN